MIQLIGEEDALVIHDFQCLNTTDNPLLTANAKTKKLRTLLERRKACRNRANVIQRMLIIALPADCFLRLRQSN